jgi:hypothetical protein
MRDNARNMEDMESPKTCQALFSGILVALHNQCLYSNAFYGLAGLFSLAALPGWWKLIGVAVLAVGVVSYVHHTQEKGVLGVGFWGKLDTGLATTLVVAGGAMLAGLMARAETRATVGPFFGAAVLLLAIYSLGLFLASRVAAHKTGGSGDATKGWGNGPLLVEEGPGGKAPAPPVECAKERYQVDYLALHSAWHGFSAACILLMLVALRRVLVPGMSHDGV